MGRNIDNAYVDDLTYQFLLEYRDRVLARGIRFHVAAGISNDPAHGGTHGPGAFDLHGSTRTPEQRLITMEIGRELGAACWVRDEDHGGFEDEHVHGIIIGHPEASTNGRRQWEAYLDGYNGLGMASGFRNGRDYHTRAFVNNRWTGLGGARKPNLNIGSRGNYVAAIQRFLKSHYSYASDIDVDGIFGPKTAEAVRQWKNRSGLYNDSEINDTVWSALKKAGLEG